MSNQRPSWHRLLSLSLPLFLAFGFVLSRAATPTAYAQLTCAEPHIWVSDGTTDNQLERFNSDFTFNSDLTLGGILIDPHDIKVGPDGNIYIANTTTTVGAGSIIQYNPTTDVSTTVANVPNPFGRPFGPDGNLYVTGGGGTSGGNRVYQLDMADPFPISPTTFVATTDNVNYRINRAHEGIEFGPDGHLYVVSNLGAAGPPVSHHGVLRFDGTTGAFLNIVLTLDPGASTYNLRDIIFDAAGNLYISEIEPTLPTSTPGTISRYTISAGVGTHSLTFAATTPVNRPVGMAFAPNGELYVVHRQNRVNRFNPDTGAFIDHFGTTELDNPKAIALTHCLDWGDLPNSYGTSVATSGPRHIIGDPLRLGVCVDPDGDGQADGGATGDDSGAGQAGRTTLGSCLLANDDEDGVVFPTNATDPGRSNWSDGDGHLNVSVTGGDGCLNVWVDFGDGTDPTPNPFVPNGQFDVVIGPMNEHVVVNQ